MKKPLRKVAAKKRKRFYSRSFVSCRAVGLAKAGPFAVPFFAFFVPFCG
jgi:hypothetical protein